MVPLNSNSSSHLKQRKWHLLQIYICNYILEYLPQYVRFPIYNHHSPAAEDLLKLLQYWLDTQLTPPLKLIVILLVQWISISYLVECVLLCIIRTHSSTVTSQHHSLVLQFNHHSSTSLAMLVLAPSLPQRRWWLMINIFHISIEHYNIILNRQWITTTQRTHLCRPAVRQSLSPTPSSM